MKSSREASLAQNILLLNKRGRHARRGPIPSILSSDLIMQDAVMVGAAAATS